jgi:hypothetical protein
MAILEAAWGDLALEFNTIEGPFAQCRMAELVVRKAVNLLINIVLILLPLAAAAKAVISGVRGLAEFALLVREVGILEALSEVAGGAGKAARKFVKAAAGEVEALAKLLRHPVETLIAARQKINVILLAAKDRGVYQTLRGLAGGLAEAEIKRWERERAAWRELGQRQAARHGAIAQDAEGIVANLNDSKVPEDGSAAVNDINSKATSLDGEVQTLEDDIKGEAGKVSPGTSPKDIAGLATDELSVVQQATGQEHDFTLLTDGRIIRCSDECLELVDSSLRRLASLPPEASEEAASIKQEVETLAKEYRAVVGGQPSAPISPAKRAEIKAKLESLEQRLANLETKSDVVGLSPDTAPIGRLQPGSPEHKAARWREYLERKKLENKPALPYDQWSKIYELNMVRWEKANEAALAYQKQLALPDREFTIPTPYGDRRIDMGNEAATKGIEYKTGYQYLSEDNLSEIQRDRWLVQQEWDITWVFQGRASAPLLEELARPPFVIKVVFR